jgi:hypothetical protein
MRLQIPTHTPLAFITLVGACGGAQSSEGGADAYQVSVGCEGDELGSEIIADLREHGFVNATHFDTDARGMEWMTSVRSGLDRLASRLPLMPDSGFSREESRSGQILVLTDSELTPETELLLITAWSEAPVGAGEIPDPMGMIGYSASVLRCTAAGLWEPLAHNDLSMAYSYVNITGLRTGQTDQGTIHTVILQDVNPMAYPSAVFDFALVFGNGRAGASVAEPDEYAYHYGNDGGEDWGPLSYLGQFYAIGYATESYYAVADSESALLMEASDWFPIEGTDSDPYSNIFLALHARTVLNGYFEYDEYYDSYYNPSVDQDYGDYYGISNILQALEAESLFGESAEIQAFGALYDDNWGGLGVSDGDFEGGIAGLGVEETFPIETLTAEDDALAFIGGALRALPVNSTASQYDPEPAERTASIALTPMGGIGAAAFSAYGTELPAAFVLILAEDACSRFTRRGWHCRTLSEADRHQFADTELGAEAVAGAWPTWQGAASAAELLRLGTEEFLILGPDPLSTDQNWDAYFAEEPPSLNGESEQLDEVLRRIHPRLRMRINLSGQ